MARFGSLPLWLVAALGYGMVVANFVAVPVLAVLAPVLPAAAPLLAQAAGASLLFWLGAIPLRAGVRDGQPLAPWVLRMPLFIVLGYAGFIASAWGSTVRWGDAEYRMGLDGRIRHVVRR